jgi:hypothetical protein
MKSLYFNSCPRQHRRTRANGNDIAFSPALPVLAVLFALAVRAGILFF